MNDLFSVVVPGHNEAENLKILIPRLRDGLSKLQTPFEIIFVNNASRDNTSEVIKEFQLSVPELKMVDEQTMGYGRAVLTGLRASIGNYIAIMRSDLQEKVEDLCTMFLKMRDERCDVYKGIRNTRVNDGLKRIVVSRLYNFLYRLLFNLKSRDLGATPKILTRTFYEAAQLESTDWFIDPEIIIKAEKMGYKVGEMKIEYLPRIKGKSTVRFRHIAEFIRNMIQWRLRIAHGRLLER